ncbi:hypothetical protein GCM10023318_20190 [Nocardia callitridis]|uniref:Uncharacterized protein n=1 Tax=Nocardia callitridis TaxID=648753 RepID=A0ABP9K6W2_9NOCA
MLSPFVPVVHNAPPEPASQERTGGGASGSGRTQSGSSGTEIPSPRPSNAARVTADEPKR